MATDNEAAEMYCALKMPHCCLVDADSPIREMKDPLQNHHLNPLTMIAGLKGAGQ
jgi:hypothetical protein